MTDLGQAERLDPGNLPTSLQLFSYYLHLRSVKVSSGEWKSNVPKLTVVKEVVKDMMSQWDKTAIPHLMKNRTQERKLLKIVEKCGLMVKTPVERRGGNFGKELDQLFDIALCQHEDMGSCSCDAGSKVPPNWRDFLLDQRGVRQSKALYSDRARSLRGGVRDLTEKEKGEQELNKKKVENKIKKEKQLVDRKRKSEQDIDDLFKMVRMESEDEEDKVESLTANDEDDGRMCQLKQK